MKAIYRLLNYFTGGFFLTDYVNILTIITEVAVKVESIHIGGEEEMNNECDEVSNWSDSYLDDMELLHGAFNLHPDLTTEELCEEWKECFRAVGKIAAEAVKMQNSLKWSDSYLDIMETLHGAFNLHPDLTIQELCEEWQRCFMSDGISLNEIDQTIGARKSLKHAS